MSGIDIVYGPLLIGVFLNCILYGVLVMQVFIYYQTYRRDRTWIRLFVAYLFLAETVNTACDMYLIYQPLVQEFGQVAAVTFFPSFLASSGVITVAISSPVQIFMGWRIRVITGSYKIFALIVAFSTISFSVCIWDMTQVATFKLFSRKDSFIFILPGIIWFVSSTVADVLITATLVYSLSRRKTGITKSNLSIDRIIRLTIQTGLTTMVFAILDLLLFTLSPNTAISFVWDFALSKLYTNSLLSTLNARAGWDQLNSVEDADNVLFGTSTAAPFSSGTGSQSRTVGGSLMPTFAPSKSNMSGNTFELRPKGELAINVETVKQVQGGISPVGGNDRRIITQ